MNAYRDRILKEFKIDQQRRSSWLCYKVWVLSKTQDLTTAEERERTKVVPYALDVGSTVCYAKYRTWCVPCHMSGKRVQRWSRSGSPDSGQNCPWSNKDMFLDYGGDKEFGVKGYVDASFNTYPDDSE